MFFGSRLGPKESTEEGTSVVEEEGYDDKLSEGKKYKYADGNECVGKQDVVAKEGGEGDLGGQEMDRPGFCTCGGMLLEGDSG